MIQADETFDGREIPLNPGEELELSLEENRTTGFRWHLKNEGQPAVTVLAEESAVPADPLGAPGIHRWRFRAQNAGEGTIETIYARSWHEGQPPAKQFALTVRVATGQSEQSKSR